MTAEEYFGDWIKVINKEELAKIMRWIGSINNPSTICPSPKNIFKAFRICPYNNCKVIMIGQDQGSWINRMNCWKAEMLISSQANL